MLTTTVKNFRKVPVITQSLKQSRSIVIKFVKRITVIHSQSTIITSIHEKSRAMTRGTVKWT